MNKRFLQFFLEYRHNLADGTAKPSIQSKNSKNPNRLNKKKLHTVGDYKHKNRFLHRPGTILVGNKLTDALAQYDLVFEPDKQVQIKNSPNALLFYLDANQNPAAKVIETK